MALQQVKIDNTGTYGGFDSSTGQGFAASDQANFGKYFNGATPDQNAPLLSSLGNFDTSSVTGANANRLVQVKLNPSTTTNTNTLSASPVTSADITSKVGDISQFQQQVLAGQQEANALMQPSADENAAVGQKNQAYNDLQNFDVSLEGGQQAIMKKPIALEFQQGQQAALIRDASFTRSSLARSYDASVNNLSAIQNQRNQLLQAAQQNVQFGQNNIATQLQLDQIKSQEQAAALKFAIDYNITKPYFFVGSEIRNTATGKGYTSEADFKKQTGMDVATAVSKGIVQTPRDPSIGEGSIQKIGEHYDDNTGAMVGDYAFVTKTGQVTPVNGSTPSGSTDLTSTFNQLFPDGTYGGQCGDFMHQLVDCPPVGDTIASKQAVVNKQGVTADDWRAQGAQIGDVLVENYGSTGHIAVVTGINPNGTVTVKESNFNGKGTVDTRTLSMTDPKIYGAIRAPLKGSPASTAVSPNIQAYAQQYASEGKFPVGMPKGFVGPVAQAAKDLPKQAGEIVNAQTNVRPPKDDTKVNALSDLYSTIELAKQLKDLDAQRTRGLWGGLVGNLDSNNKRYNDLRTQITDLLARARTGAAINASEESLYAGMLPGSWSNVFGIGANTQSSIENFVNNLSKDLTQKASANGWSIYGVSKVSVNGQQYTVGDILDNGTSKARVNPDGTLSPL